MLDKILPRLYCIFVNVWYIYFLCIWKVFIFSDHKGFLMSDEEKVFSNDLKLNKHNDQPKEIDNVFLLDNTKNEIEVNHEESKDDDFGCK